MAPDIVKYPWGQGKQYGPQLIIIDVAHKMAEDSSVIGLHAFSHGGTKKEFLQESARASGWGKKSDYFS